MTEQQEAELRQIRASQNALREQWARLEERLSAVEARTLPGLAPAENVPVVGRVLPPAEISAVPASREQPPYHPAAPAPDAVPESLEMQIGTVWLVRAGIVLLLTSLAFAGNYLYQNVVPHLGPGGKVALLYLAAAVLTGFGAWLERSRQAREIVGLQNYARVVLAGGLAAIYYVTYAAHYFPNLRVVQSALAAGLLLLGWAAFLVWLADRRESEILATFAILLAYYTSAISEIASFTLFSNLVLSAGAVYLMRRHLWRIFPFASLLATFGSYGFWHYFYVDPVWRVFDTHRGPLQSDGGFWLEGGFLLLYWALFTWAVFTTGDEMLPAPRRATFISLNNGAFFLLTTWILLGEYPNAFWKWSLVCGCVLAGLGEAGRRFRPPLERASENAYQLQGSLLITLGFIDYFSGWELSLILAVQSRILLAAALQRRRGLWLTFAWATGLAAFISAANVLLFGIIRGSGSAFSWITPLVVGAFFMEESWQCERLRRRTLADPGASAAAPHWPALLRGAAGCFGLLGAGMWYWLLETKITFEPALSPSLAMAAVALLLLGYVLRVAAIPFFAQGYLLAALYHWLYCYGGVPGWGTGSPPWWNVTVLIVAFLVFGQVVKLAPDLGIGTEAGRLSLALQIFTMVLGTLCGWCYVSRHLMLLHGSPFNMAARWSLYGAAVFVVGLLWRERVYRWLGLAILIATLGRVVLFDIWQIDLLERALSFLTLGAVLLGIGFFYSRFGSRVRDIL
jgi:uncharacterized membrane protein